MHLLQLEKQVVKRLCLATLFGQIDSVESIHLLRCLTVLTSCTGERCIRVMRQLRETVV